MGRSTRTGVLVSVLLSGLAAYAIAAPGQTDPGEVSTGPSVQLAQPAEGPAALERPDCVLQEGVCRSECAYHADEKRCIVRRCEPLFLQCTASLPVGKVVSLPFACMTADQEAVRRLERQGELLDADPTLFADSFTFKDGKLLQPGLVLVWDEDHVQFRGEISAIRFATLWASSATDKADIGFLSDYRGVAV